MCAWFSKRCVINILSNHYKLCSYAWFLLLDFSCRQFSINVLVCCQDDRLQNKISFLKRHICHFGFPCLRLLCFLLLLFYLPYDIMLFPATTARGLGIIILPLSINWIDSNLVMNWFVYTVKVYYTLKI